MHTSWFFSGVSIILSFVCDHHFPQKQNNSLMLEKTFVYIFLGTPEYAWERDDSIAHKGYRSVTNVSANACSIWGFKEQ